jgi:beta-lactam-binding protein with PASTA domain
VAVALLDGKYEILEQRPLAEHQTLFEATAPDGARLIIVWYDLPPDQEGAFERYRRTLKRLKRSDTTALYDVVSRPGARYVAWERAPEGAGSGRSAELTRLLAEAGVRLDDADIRRVGRTSKLYGLAFGGVVQRSLDGAPGERSATPEGSEDTPTRRDLPAPLISWGASGLMLVLAAVLLLAGLRRSANDRLAVVPELLGQPVAEAIAELYDLGFAVVAHEVAADAPTGVVVELSPIAGSQLRPGRSVEVGYALPPGSFASATAPQLVGTRYPDDAEGALRSSGLELGRAARIPADVPAGIIISQSPPAGDALEQGATVDILVSQGPLDAATFLPDLVGMSEADARDFAELAGLRPERVLVDRIAVPGAAPGSVVSQSLAPNQVLPQGSTLRLVINEGATEPAIGGGTPSLIGLDRSEAERRARAAGMTPTVVERGVLQLPEGVMMQSPQPGEAATGAIALVVNIHPRPIPVPEVRAEVLPPEPRSVAYRWFIEAGIPRVTAVVTATTLEGDRRVVARRPVEGGDTLEGVWITSDPGPISFALTLNGSSYGETLRVR